MCQYHRHTFFCRCFRFSLLVLGLLLLAVALTFSAHLVDGAPMGTYFLFSPLYLWVVGKMYCSIEGGVLLARFSGPVRLVGLLCLAIWVMWLMRGNFWTDDLQAKYAQQIDLCAKDFQPQADINNNSQCFSAYLLWFSPLFVAINCLLTSLVMHFLSDSVHDAKKGILEKEAMLDAIWSVIMSLCINQTHPPLLVSP